MSYISPKLEWDTTYNAYAMYTPWNENFLKMFKKNIPWQKTKQIRDSAGKHVCWLIEDDLVPQLTPILQLFWPHIKITSKDTVITAETAKREEEEHKLREAREAQEKINQAQANSSNYVPPQRKSVTPQSILIEEWFLLLPWQAAKKAMLEASKMLHPDITKDTASADKLAELNSKWSQIEKLLKK